jgi:hypothetical protein
MLTLEQTTLFYHNFAFRTFDKTSAGVIKSWAADVQSPTFAGRVPARSSKVSSSTLVSKASRSKPVELVLSESKPVQKSTKTPLSEPLRLIDTSDEDYLAGRPSRSNIKMVSDKHDYSTKRYNIFITDARQS